MRAAYLLLLSLLPLGYAAAPERFVPSHRLTGIGVGRDDLSEDLLDTRTDLMIQSQTFTIMREPEALAGAKRITRSLPLQKLFKSASASSGIPATVIEAIAYLESWGDPKAESPGGSTRHHAGLGGHRLHHGAANLATRTRYRVTTQLRCR